MNDVFLCKLCMCKYFTSMLNSQEIEIANISENKVLVNNSEFTVCNLYS